MDFFLVRLPGNIFLPAAYVYYYNKFFEIVADYVRVIIEEGYRFIITTIMLLKMAH